MKYADGSAKIIEYRQQIATIRQKMRETQKAVEPQPVPDYEFLTSEGSIHLLQLFGKQDDLIMIHNMGTGCSSCTLWADGYSGIHHHVASRAAFVVSSPDTPEIQREFAAGRGWTFPMVSHVGTSFAADMGFRSSTGGWTPGISVFQRDGNQIVRVSDAKFSPGDDFCSVWHMFDMLPDGAADWRPKSTTLRIWIIGEEVDMCHCA